MLKKLEAPVWIKVIRAGLRFDGNLTVKGITAEVGLGK